MACSCFRFGGRSTHSNSSRFTAATGSLSSPTVKWNPHGVDPTLPDMWHRHMPTAAADTLVAADESESPVVASCAGHGAAEDEDGAAGDSAGDGGVGSLISASVSASNIEMVSSLTSFFNSRMHPSRVGSAIMSTHWPMCSVGVL